MKLIPIVTALRTRCARFENRVEAAAQLTALPKADTLTLPSAYVVPANDITGDQMSQTDYWQSVTEGFAVIVVLSNEPDETGQWIAYDDVQDVRLEIWNALLGWQPDSDSGEIHYAGGQLRESDSTALYYQFDFTVNREIAQDTTRQAEDLAALDALGTIAIDIDFIEPGMGPDGEIEHHTDIHFNE